MISRTSDSALRDRAVRNVDARAGHTFEFSADPESHRAEYEAEEGWLKLAAALTRQQRQALRNAFEESEDEGYGSDSMCWDGGVRPWPTMDNLAKLGFCRYIGWEDEPGRMYSLTADGADLRQALVSERHHERLATA